MYNMLIFNALSVYNFKKIYVNFIRKTQEEN